MNYDDIAELIWTAFALGGALLAGRARRRSIEDRKALGERGRDGLLALVARMRVMRRSYVFFVQLIFLGSGMFAIVTEPSELTRVIFSALFVISIVLLFLMIATDTRADSQIDRYIERRQ